MTGTIKLMEPPMQKANGHSDLVLDSGHIDDLGRSVRTSRLDDKILAIASEMAPGAWRKLNPEKVVYSTWATAVRRLKASHRLAESFRIERHKTEYYFVNRPVRSESVKKPGE